MYECTCVYIHVHTYQVYIKIYVYLFRFNFDIILLVVSDCDDGAKSWKSLFENPGVFAVHELHEVFVHSKHHSLVHQIVTKRRVSNGDDLVGATVNALGEARRK